MRKGRASQRAIAWPPSRIQRAHRIENINPDTTEIFLSSNNIGTQGAQALARTLQECKNLTTLDLCDNSIGTQGAQALARALQECKNLTTLNLCDNSIGTQGAQALARTLQECKNLTTLKLWGNNIGPQGAQALARALQECKNLTSLDLSWNNIGPQGAQALARVLQECKNFTTLELSSNKIGTQGAQALARALQECKNLTTLDLSHNNIGTQGAQALARVLQECKNLTTLKLSSNKIGTQGAQALAQALQECKNLTTLELWGNNIGPQGAQALARALQECKNLTSLDLSHNNIGTQGAQALARALQECKNLTTLELSSNKIGTQGAQALARALQECKNLTTLDLSHNNIGTQDAQALARALQECKNLTTLDLSHNNIGTQDAQALPIALKECKNLTTLDLSHNNIGTQDAQALPIALKECKNPTTVRLYPVSKVAEQPTIRTRVRTGVTAVVAQVLWFLNLTLSSGQFFVFRFVLVLGTCMQCIGISSLRAITLVIQLDLFPCLLRYVSFVVSFCIVYVVWFCTWLWSFHSSNKTTEDLKKTKDTAGNRNLNANADLLDNVLKNFKMKLGKENSDCRVSLGSGDDFLNDGITLLEEFASPSVQKYILQMKLQQAFRDIMKSKTSLETLQDQIRASSQHRLSSLVEQRNNKRNQLRALLIIVYSYLRAGRDNIHEHYDADVMRVFKVKLDSLLDRLDTIDGLSAAQNIDGNILDCLRNLVGRAKLCVKAYRLNKIGRLSDMEEPSNVISKRVRSGESELGQGDTSYRDARAREGTAAFECKLLYIQSMLQEDKMVAEVAEILWSVGSILQQLESAETIKLSNSTRPSLKIFMEIKDYVQLGMREPDVDHLKNLYKQLTDSRNAMEGLKRAKADLEAEESEEEKAQCRSRIARHEGILAKGTPIELSELFRHKVAETLRLAQIHYPELLKNQEWLELLHISAEGLLEVACSGLWLATVNTSDFQPVGEPLASRGGKKVRKVLDNAGRTLVLKEFLLGHSSQSKTFYKQVANLDKVVSQHVIRIKSAFIDSSGEDLRGCIIMPFYEQGDLAKWIAEHSKEGKAVRDRLAIGLLAGVADLHANGIVHCDIKPENIFLTNNGTPLLGDFDGIKIADCTATYTSFQATPGYIAPELQNGRIDKFTAKIDMYSVGVVLQDLYPTPAAAMRQLIDSLKAIDPNLRPSAREALQHNAFGAVEVRVETCLICMERVQFSEGTSCENGDFLCRDCIASSVAAAAQPQASVKVDASGTMLCTKPGCNGRIFGRDIARLAPDALNHLLRIVRMRVESKAAVWAEQEIRRRLDQIRRADGLTRDAQRHLLYIQENILNSCCPNCSACFDHFNGCCAVKCGHDGCNHNFCAWCLEYSSQDSDACHRHVRHCPRKRGQDPYFPDSFEQVREAWQLLRAERLRDYWNTHIQDRYLQGVLRKQLAPFLTQDIIGPNFSLQ